FKQSSIILEVDARFRAKTFEPFQKSTIAFVSTTRLGSALNSAHLIKVMQFLYRRHPEIWMGIELLIQPGCARFMGADTQKIRPRPRSRRTVPFLMPAATTASVQRPSPSHLSLSPRWSLWQALRLRAAVPPSRHPIPPEQECD